MSRNYTPLAPGTVVRFGGALRSETAVVVGQHGDRVTLRADCGAVFTRHRSRVHAGPRRPRREQVAREASRTGGRLHVSPPDAAERVERLAERAAQGLPLFPPRGGKE